LSYKEYVNSLIQEIPDHIVNLTAKRKRGNPPTQAFSDFLTHSEQGDWAEVLFYNSLKALAIPYPYVPVRYGKSDKITAGDPNFREFYNSYQDELDSIGKRPDILLFASKHYNSKWLDDVSNLPREELLEIVPLALAGIEVRSSAYLTRKFVSKKERPFLSFTPKVEDLVIVLKWINTFDVPHYYLQVFFDAIYIIPFVEILLLLKDADFEEGGSKIKGRIDNELAFVIEKNPKNQFKETIHIFVNQGYRLGDILEEPELVGKRKELSSGRLLHYVTFTGGKAKVDESILLPLIEKPF